MKFWSQHLQYLQSYLEIFICHLAAAKLWLETDNMLLVCRYIIKIWRLSVCQYIIKILQFWQKPCSVLKPWELGTESIWPHSFSWWQNQFRNSVLRQVPEPVGVIHYEGISSSAESIPPSSGPYCTYASDLLFECLQRACLFYSSVLKCVPLQLRALRLIWRLHLF